MNMRRASESRTQYLPFAEGRFWVVRRGCSCERLKSHNGRRRRSQVQKTRPGTVIGVVTSL